MTDPGIFKLGDGYQPQQQTPTPPPVYPPLDTLILDVLDQLEEHFPGLNRNTAQIAAHVLAYTKHPAPALLDIAAQFIAREQARATRPVLS